MSHEQDAASQWLTDRAIYYVENFSMLPKTALRLALRDLLAATVSAALRPVIQTALHEVLDGLPSGLRKVGKRPKPEPRISKVKRIVLERLPTDPKRARQPSDLTFGLDGEPFTSAHAYSLLIEMESAGLAKSVQIPGTERRGWIKVAAPEMEDREDRAVREL